MAFGFRSSSSLDSCTGAEVKMHADGTVELRLLNLSLHKKLININWKKNQASTLDKFNANISGPVAITLTGRGILFRKTNRIEELTSAGLQGLFPGLKFSEFYVQNFISGDYSFVALIRKETLNLVLKAFVNRKHVLVISIGVFLVDHVIPQLNIYIDDLEFDGHSISLKEDQTWIDYKPSTLNESGFVLKVDIETIEEKYLLAYAAAFQLILSQRLEPIQIDVEEVQLNKIDFFAKLLFEKRLTIMILSLFLILLVNFFLFTYYNLENANNTGMASQRSEVFLNQKKVGSEISKKELLVERLGWNNGLSYAFICDQIGLIVPSSVTLTELSVNIPFVKNVSELESGTKQVKVVGQAPDVYAVNQFIYACKNRKWVKQVKLQKFIADDQQKTQVFSIVIDY
jgi:hypothetical protein